MDYPEGRRASACPRDWLASSRWYLESVWTVRGMVRVTGKRLFGWIFTVLAVILFPGHGALLEAMATVRDERSQDYELLDICQRGEARGSAKMRAACLQAQADRASPLMLKAIVRAVSTA